MSAQAPLLSVRAIAQIAIVGWAALAISGVVPSRGQSPQTPTPDQRPVFRTGVDLVTLDVSVLDKERRPVRGLSARDFILLEDGAQQTIEGFSEIDLPDPEPIGTGWMAKTPSDVETNGGESRRLIAIVLDDSMLPYDPIFVNGTKKIARDIVTKMSPNDAAAIIFTRDNRHGQSFTTDRAKLFAAIDTVTPGMAYVPNTDDYPFWIASEHTLLDVALDLISLPDKRKMLVFVSPGVPAKPPPPGAGTSIVRVWDTMKDTIERAQRANVTFYGYDPGGLEAMELFCGRMNVSCKGSPQQFHDFLLTIADNTGGKATIFTNDPVPDINGMFAENNSYYLLGYRQPNPQKIGDIRRLQVKIANRPDLDVRTRHYNRREAGDDERAAKKKQVLPSASLKSIAEAIPDATTPLRLNLVPMARTDGSGATIIVTVGVTEPAPLTRGRETIDLQVRAFTLDAQPRGEKVATVYVPVAPAAGPTIRFDILSRLDIAKPGRYTVRVGLENHERHATGSVFADIDVPDFTAPLALSGVALDASDAPQTASTDLLKSVLPISPTTDRVFSTSSRVTGFVRLYESGTPAPVTIRTTIRNAVEVAVFDKSDAIVAALFADRHQADFRFDLPLNRLEPGKYLLTLEASSRGRSVSRDVVFTVR